MSIMSDLADKFSGFVIGLSDGESNTELGMHFRCRMA